MIIDPKEVLKEYRVFGNGKIQLGRGNQIGMKVGLDPYMVRLLIPEGCGLYPNDWFVLREIKNELQFEKLFDSEKENYIPDFIMLECFRSAWKKLYWKDRLK